ncbi:hypothetical protein LB467_10915 [Salegentibacter sp. JZCK2]|uniref:hypothetical protein n=1 Tax=Salegentibacter tibetensis TaxID=2873600 RepID=UPI001CCFA230|nr:hypothetical protein [Salegentibacter tibetensis]MBZ9730197.1 hypothetical protein [Salegentibacter tibetensis]
MKILNKMSLLMIVIIIFGFTSCSSDNSENSKESQVEELEVKSDVKKEVEGNWLEVGVIRDGQPVITGDKKALLESWNSNLLKLSGIKGDFTDVYIYGTDGGYQLIFKGSVFQSSFYVKRNDSASLFAAGDTSCTTSDCPQEPEGCVVKYELSKPGAPGYCSPCANGGKCTKTTSNFSMISF